jgi:hypothetical protein
MLNLTVTISPEAECGALARRWKGTSPSGRTLMPVVVIVIVVFMVAISGTWRRW